MAILTIHDVGFSYEGHRVLSNISMEFESGTVYAITGPSGAGKTTLLSLLSGLARVQEGTILYDGRDTREIDGYDYRSHDVGVIFQSFNLLNKLTAVENVELSMDIAGVRVPNQRERALELLASVGLDADESNRRVLKLSGGQQQRVAIARALSYGPRVILADEPTGNLDPETASEIMDIFEGLARAGTCVIIVTHSKSIARRADVTFRLKRGQSEH